MSLWICSIQSLTKALEDAIKTMRASGQEFKYRIFCGGLVQEILTKISLGDFGNCYPFTLEP